MEGRGKEMEEGVMRVLLVDDSPVDRRVAQLLLNSNSCAGSFHVFCALKPIRSQFDMRCFPKVLIAHSVHATDTTLLESNQLNFHTVIAVDSAKKAMEFLGLTDGKALNPLKPIPVIVMSSEDEPQRISRCLSAGAEDYIVKPLQSKDVQRLRNCTLAKPKGSSPCDPVTKRKHLPAPDHAAAAVSTASPSERRAHFTGVAMARTAFVKRRALPILPAPLQARPAAVRRPLPGRAAAQMVIAQLPALAVVRLSSSNGAPRFRAG
ncbi:hypothetical protein EJB05_56131 [Eragrostis curvula]|uniref:Response regulatory domain-containing protein n=1 Tax=Eragrostis curvula TaxID=38414 RepID=A0A5J9SI85_9POAL|nr:hypothetical protein EJB05_56131 [Eragrostis curvula]